MMKKIAIVVAFCLLFMCSCSTSSDIYENQENINFNYNNISNYAGFWLTTDSICISEHSIFATCFIVDKTSKKKIDFGLGKIQQYGDKIYILEETSSFDDNRNFRFKLYDINSNKIEKIISVKNWLDFLVLNKSIYYLEENWFDDVYTVSLNKLSLDSKERNTINNNVLSFGVIENSLCYMTKENNKILIFKYDAEEKTSIKYGEFLLEGANTELFNDYYYYNVTISYTNNYVFISRVDYEYETTSILRYSFKTSDLSNMTVDGDVNSFVSYDANSYFLNYSETSKNSELFLLNNDTNEFTKIAEFKGMGSLFVGSDKGAYVSKDHDGDLTYYSNEGDSQFVFSFS